MKELSHNARKWVFGVSAGGIVFQKHILFFRNLNLVILEHFGNESEWTVGTLCARLLIQFYSDSFETLQMS